MALIGKAELPVVIPVAVSVPLCIALAQPNFFDWLDRWQTLVAAGLATLAAAATGYLLWFQIKSTERREQRELGRRHQSKRFLMSFALSTASRYCDDVVKALAQAVIVQQSSSLAGNWRPPVFPSEVGKTLSEFLETSDNQSANQLVGEAINQLQVLDARLESLISDERTFRIGVGFNIAEYQIQAMKIRHICGALFGYARGNTATVPLSFRRADVIASLEFADAGEHNPSFDRAIEAFGKSESWEIR